MLIRVSIPDERIALCVVGANIRAWGRFDAVDTAANCYAVIDLDRGNDQPINLNIDRGLTLMAEKYPGHFADLMSLRGWDSETGDVLVQLSAFGELVYG